MSVSFVIVTMIMRVVMSTSEVIIDDLFNKEKADYAGDDNSIDSHLLWVMSMSTFLATSMIMSVPVVMSVMIMTMSPAAAIRLSQMRKRVEEHVSQKSANRE